MALGADGAAGGTEGVCRLSAVVTLGLSAGRTGSAGAECAAGGASCAGGGALWLTGSFAGGVAFAAALLKLDVFAASSADAATDWVEACS